MGLDEHGLPYLQCDACKAYRNQYDMVWYSHPDLLFHFVCKDKIACISWLTGFLGKAPEMRGSRCD